MEHRGHTDFGQKLLNTQHGCGSCASKWRLESSKTIHRSQRQPLTTQPSGTDTDVFLEHSCSGGSLYYKEAHSPEDNSGFFGSPLIQPLISLLKEEILTFLRFEQEGWYLFSPCPCRWGALDDTTPHFLPKRGNNSFAGFWAIRCCFSSSPFCRWGVHDVTTLHFFLKIENPLLALSRSGGSISPVHVLVDEGSWSEDLPLFVMRILTSLIFEQERWSISRSLLFL